MNGKRRNVEVGIKEPGHWTKQWWSWLHCKEKSESMKKNMHEAIGKPENQVNSNQKRMVSSVAW